MKSTRRVKIGRIAADLPVSVPSTEEKSSDKQNCEDKKASEKTDEGKSDREETSIREPRPADTIQAEEEPSEEGGRRGSVAADVVQPGQSDGGDHGSEPGERAEDGNPPGRRGDPTGGEPQSIELCGTCGNPWSWQDPYCRGSGPWRCLTCDPPPSESMVARYRDGRVDQAEREFVDKYECYDLIDEDGRVWMVARRRGRSCQACPRDLTLKLWPLTLRKQLLCELFPNVPLVGGFVLC